MAAGLARGELDIAMLLTEGAVAAQQRDAEFSIVGTFTDSPLTWGIHVPANSELHEIEDIKGARYAISRIGSGSHLMSFAHARQQGWPTSALNFVIVNTLPGAITAFAEGLADVFFWERFMTQPLVDSGDFRRIGEFSAPWPAFVICARRGVMAAHEPAVNQLIEAVFRQARKFEEGSHDSVELIVSEYGLQPQDALTWLQQTRWSRKLRADTEMLANVAAVLRDAGALG